MANILSFLEFGRPSGTEQSQEPADMPKLGRWGKMHGQPPTASSGAGQKVHKPW